MNNPYDIHTWSKHYRENILRDVNTLRLERRAAGGGRGVTRTIGVSTLRNLLGLLRAARQAT